MDESAARKLICEIGKLLYERSYVVAFDGNVSIRLDENTVLATPTMTCKGRMTEDCLALTDMDGKPLSDKVITEAWKHLSFGYEPLTAAISKVASDATDLGLLKKVDLKGVYDVRILNQLLAKAGKPAVSET